MDKLELNLDDLEVDSFRTNPEQEGKQGTVQGNDHSCHSCDVTCDDTCVCPTPPVTDDESCYICPTPPVTVDESCYVCPSDQICRA